MRGPPAPSDRNPHRSPRKDPTPPPSTAVKVRRPPPRQHSPLSGNSMLSHSVFILSVLVKYFPSCGSALPDTVSRGILEPHRAFPCLSLAFLLPSACGCWLITPRQLKVLGATVLYLQAMTDPFSFFFFLKISFFILLLQVWVFCLQVGLWTMCIPL